ncbi:ATP-binding protein [Streptomyces rubrolavendulae]|uniref:ATP-binding protein n=1 Tax=Streptomyces rubrolavendulae TaxID=285473 RepID=UPI001F3B3D26|nr:ATP-binding protein [Streptomyces rubrolavendulae]
MLVARLLELEAAGALTTAHVRAGAQVGGVNVRTVWRWLDAARTEGRVERRPRARLELSDQAWEVLAQAGGNVAALHRHLKATGGEVPSLASLYRVVRRDLQAGRVLPDRAVARRERDEQQTRQALADLALAGPSEGGAAKVAARWPPHLVPEATGSLPVGENGALLAGVALPAGAQLVRTRRCGPVAEAVGQAMATQGAVCGVRRPGPGKTAAVRMALGEVPPGWKATWVPVPVRPSVAGMRRAVFDALGLPGPFPATRRRWPMRRSRGLWLRRGCWWSMRRSAFLRRCLEYFQSSGTTPASGSRWCCVGRAASGRWPGFRSWRRGWSRGRRFRVLTGAEVASVVTGFHPLWRTVPAPELTWIDQSCAHGTLRTWAAVTAHLQNALLTTSDASVDRALLRRLFKRVAPPL